ncbi:MAG: IS30-like element ISTde2 family transposase [Treponemataceae bacterium]|nr:MAG: IS30-like element ISTde2 family transposase [Treponemataceae bacterium]
MGKDEYTPKAGAKGSHWTYEQRRFLECMWQGLGTFAKMRDKSELARQFGKSRRTIQRELARGKYMHLNSDLTETEWYSADLAQNKTEREYIEHGPDLKIGSDHVLCAAIRDGVRRRKRSPYAIVAGYETDGWPTETRLCEKTIYRYIAAGYIPEVTQENLLYHGKRQKRSGRNAPKHSRSGCLARSIDNRPEDVNNRTEAGHWEMDTVKGSKAAGLLGHHECLLTLTERKSRMEIIRKLPDGKEASVVAAIDELERSFGAQRFTEIFHSFTPDNGSEFMDFDGLEKSVFSDKKRVTLYYAHPYSAFERGTNENANGMIRRHFPKGADFALVPDTHVSFVQDWINNYPRKIHDGKAASSFYLPRPLQTA